MKNKILILALLVILGSIIRFYELSKYPPSLNWDEISHGYNAYSILKTGKDEWGKIFPIANFRAYGDYPLSLNLYFTIPFIKIFDLNEFSIRFPHALLGSLTIISTFLLIYGFTKKIEHAVLGSLLVAISPWYVFPSRAVFQSNLSVFLLISAFAAFFLRNRKKYLLPLSALFLGLTLFSYHSTRIFSPLVLLATIFVYREEFIRRFQLKDKSFIFSVVLILLFFAPLPYILSNPEARARSNVVFILNQGAINRINNARANSNLNSLATKLIYNRPVYFIKVFIKNYIDYFSPQFLFLKGGTQYQFSVPDHGLLYLANLPFFYLGLIVLFKKAKDEGKDYQLLFLWLLLAPVPASITTERFAVIRSTTLLPLPEILTVFGLSFVCSKLKKNKQIFLLIYIVVLIFSLENYLQNYFGEYTKKYSWAWQYGYKQIVEYALSNYSKYDQIIVTKKYGEPHEYFLFYGKVDPQEYEYDSNLIRFYQSNWYWVDRFDKFSFVNDWDIPKNIKTNQFVLESKKIVNCFDRKCLLITSPDNHPLGWRFLETINFLDGKAAFELYEN
jgi:4-amino-4-deoxy-L-arabinose transferase-like glycosyltransferase